MNPDSSEQCRVRNANWKCTAFVVAAAVVSQLCIPIAKAQEERAFIDGTGPGWRALGSADFLNVNCSV